MKPQSISITNVKNRDGHYAISPVSVFTGPNWSGKTSLLSAVKIALLGYEPKLGKQHRATIQLAAENRPEMSVTMTFDTGSFSRTWKQGKDDAIKYSETNTMPKVPAILMDMAGYFGLKTEQDRVNYVFEKIDSAELGFKDDDLLTKIGTIEALPVKPAEAARTELVAFVQDSIRIRDRDKITIQDFINKLITDIKDQKKVADADHKKVGLQMQPLKPSGPAPVSQVKLLEAKQDHLKKLNDEIGNLMDQKKAWDIDQIKINELESTLGKPFIDTSKEEAELAALQKQIDGYQSATQELDNKLATLRSQTRSIEEQIKDLNERIPAKEQLLAKAHCANPDCPWENAFRQEMSDLTKQVEDLMTRSRVIVKDGKAASKARAVSAEKDKAWDEQKATASRLRQEIAGKQSVDAGGRQVLQAELESLKAKPKFNEEGLAALENQKKQINTEIAQLNQCQSQFAQYEANQVQLKTLESNLLSLQARSSVLKLALDMIGEIQQHILQRAFSSLLEKSKPFTSGLLKFDLEYSPDKAELGYKSPAGWVSHTVFSDSEQALAYAGLAVALAQQSPFKVVFMDEMGKLEAEPVNRKALVLERMCTLVEQGVIHAFFGADNRTKDYVDFKNPVFSQVILG